MLLFVYLWRKWWNNRWMTFNTFLGLLLVVAFTTSIPLYSDGSLKRVISKTLAAEQTAISPGSILMRYQNVSGNEFELAQWNDLNQYIRTTFPEEIELPIQQNVRFLSIRSATLQVVDSSKTDPSKRRQMALMGFSQFRDQIEIVRGDWKTPSEDSDKPIPVLVQEDAVDRYKVYIGDQFTYKLPAKKKLTIEITGIYRAKNETSPYWFQPLDSIVNGLIVDDQWLENELIAKRGYSLSLAYWNQIYELKQVQGNMLNALSKQLTRLDAELYQRVADTHVDISFLPLLETFKSRSTALQAMLLALALPMIALVLVFVAISAHLSAERQRNEFAVLQSRGASVPQLIRLVLLDAGMLGLLALIFGLPLGWLMAKSIGAANGFLEFVQRQPISVSIDQSTLVYGIIAVTIAALAYAIPVIRYARTSIVQMKQETARLDTPPLWHRFFIDVLLIAIAGYGYYALSKQEILQLKTGLTGAELQLSPELFVIPAIAIASLGLFTLRLFPWLLKLIHGISGRWLPVPIYLTVTQLARSAYGYFPVMILLMLTIGLGLYNAAAARTMDTNGADRVYYAMGTDVRLQAVWESVADDMPTGASQKSTSGAGSGQPNGAGQKPSINQKPGTNPKNETNPKPGVTSSQTGGTKPGGTSIGSNPASVNPEMSFMEPPIEPFRKLTGVEASARVLTHKAVAIVNGRSSGEGTMMALDNVDFANVAWFRRDLYPFHPFHYLRLLGEMEQAVIISERWAKQEQIQLGDPISLIVDGQEVNGFVAATVEYWPGINPNIAPFFIANLDYVNDQIAMLPYEMWLKMKPNALVVPIIKELNDQNIQIAEVKDVRNELIAQQKQPSRGGVFGILSLGFVLTVIVSFMGYMIYWVYALSRRVVQIGILRASGLSRRQLSFMLLAEQTLTAGLAIVMGLIYGVLVSNYYLPFLQNTDQADLQVPPFRVIFAAQDVWQLLAIVGLMVLSGLFLLVLFIRRLKISQAIKLGEER